SSPSSPRDRSRHNGTDVARPTSGTPSTVSTELPDSIGTPALQRDVVTLPVAGTVRARSSPRDSLSSTGRGSSNSASPTGKASERSGVASDDGVTGLMYTTVPTTPSAAHRQAPTAVRPILVHEAIGYC